MGILESLSKSFTQVTQIKTLIISLLAQNSYIAGCMVCANVSVALRIYICCFPVSITWAYFASLSARRTIWGPLGLSCMSFPSIRSESFTLGCRYLGSTYRQLGVHLSVCVQALAITFYDVHLHSADPSLGLGRPKWWRLQLQQHPACCRRAPLSNDHGSSQANLPLYSRLYSQVDLSLQRIWCNRVTFPPYCQAIFCWFAWHALSEGAPAHPLLCHYQECNFLRSDNEHLPNVTKSC